MTAPRVYLAGPDVFAPDAVTRGQALCRLCADHGLTGLFPLDNEITVPEGSPGPALGHAIYRANLDMMAAADACIANLSPFRGPNADDGTAFEVGWMIARGKPVFGYSDDARLLAARSAVPGRFDPDGRTLDADGWWVEDMGWPANLMLVAGIEASGGVFVAPATGDSDGPRDAFISALRAAARHLLAKA